MITNFDGDVPSPPQPKRSTAPDPTPWTTGQKQFVGFLMLALIIVIAYHVRINITSSLG